MFWVVRLLVVEKMYSKNPFINYKIPFSKSNPASPCFQLMSFAFSLVFFKNSKVCLFFGLLSTLYKTRFLSPQNSIPIYRKLSSCWCEKDLATRFTCRRQKMTLFQYHLRKVVEMLIKITKKWLHLLLVSQDQLLNHICHKKLACLQLRSLISRRKHVI